MNDKILIRLIDIEKDKFITAYYTTNWSEPFKLYSYIKENDLPYDLTIASEENKEYEDKFFKISNIQIQFGGNIGINSINIYMEVYS